MSEAKDNKDSKDQAKQPTPAEQVTNQPQPSMQYAMNQPVGDKADTKSRLAMMAFAFFAAPTGIARAYIGQTSGVVRFWIFVAAQFLGIIPFINILAGLALMVLYVWGIVDFFILKGRTVDAFNQPMSSTNRDEKFIKYLFIVMIVGLVLALLAIVVSIIFVVIVGVAGLSSVSDIKSSGYSGYSSYGGYSSF